MPKSYKTDVSSKCGMLRRCLVDLVLWFASAPFFCSSFVIILPLKLSEDSWEDWDLSAGFSLDQHQIFTFRLPQIT